MAIEDDLLELEKKLYRKYRKSLLGALRLVKKELSGIGADSVKSSPKLLKKRINRILASSGLNKIGSSFDSILEEIDKLIALEYDLKSIKGSVQKEAAKPVLAKTLIDTKKLVNDLGKKIRKRLTIANLKKETPLQAVESAFKSINGQARTIATTTVQGYDNELTTVTANDLGLYWFQYAGAKDSLNREFCADRVRNYYNDDQAKKWNNGQGLPADIYLGGYNCRHRKRYVTDEEQIEKLNKEN
ncbi:MAG: hypothetical protein ACRBG0_27800 [Lewinella sp.]|uniref:hypothetical protein n=1 Tax=Lewinella sp. TaxID=2004506 RepID=UPI003D6AE600